jgi:alpha-L-fucosidase
LAQSSSVATAPSMSLPAVEIDQQWIDASKKYDAARNQILQRVDQAGAEGPFHPDWKSLANYSAPDWYRDAKFGIFIHWGVYSVPAFDSEWYPRNMYIEGSSANKHQVATYGPLTKFGYKDFIPMFKAEKFDPEAWARLFADAGAKYVVPVFEHHDGFTMYDSSLSDWTAVKMGPKRDLDGDLARAVRAQGLHLGASSHRVEHDWFYDGGRKTASDVNDPKNAEFYGPAQSRFEDGNDAMIRDFTYASPAFLNDWLARSAEIVEKYHPDIMYFDWWIGQPSVRPYLARFAAFYYDESRKHGTAGVIDYKFDAMQENSGTLDIERGQLEATRALPWQTDSSVSNHSWGYVENDVFKTPDFIIHQLVDIVSKNGNLLMNIGPRADGTIPDEVKQVLLGVGAWLKVNGEAIYGTRPWKTFGEGPTKVTGGSFNDVRTSHYTAQDFRFTSKDGVLYAIELAWPEGQLAVIHALGFNELGVPARIRSVRLLGSSAMIAFEQKPEGLYLHLPKQAPTPDGSSFRIEFEPATGGTKQ